MFQKDYFEDEDDFRDSLAEEIKECYLINNKNGGDAEINDVIVDETHPENRNAGRPDIHIYHDGMEMEWRGLTNPFFIECKVGNSEIQNNLMQGVRYKYGTYEDLEKYGDYHVVFTEPGFCKSSHGRKNPFRDFSKDSWFTNAQLVRTIWNLGMGVMNLRKCKWIQGEKPKWAFQISFNEQERILMRKRVKSNG